ncbi:MAG: hypothetical protein Q8P67_27175, partial [archaeon]|nr:hypothetical protein [archaeon]
LKNDLNSLAVPAELPVHIPTTQSDTADHADNSPVPLPDPAHSETPPSRSSSRGRRRRPTNCDTRDSPNPKITSCEHKFREHYAKGFCYYCYEHIRSTPTETRCTPNPKIINCPHYTREHHAKGMCSSCYEHHRGPFRATKANYTLESPNPKITSCEHILKEHQAKGFCHQCYRVVSNKKRKDRKEPSHPQEQPSHVSSSRPYEYLPGAPLPHQPQYLEPQYRGARELLQLPHGTGYMQQSMMHDSYLQPNELAELQHPAVSGHLLPVPQLDMYPLHLMSEPLHHFAHSDLHTLQHRQHPHHPAAHMLPQHNTMPSQYNEEGPTSGLPQPSQLHYHPINYHHPHL